MNANTSAIIDMHAFSRDSYRFFQSFGDNFAQYDRFNQGNNSYGFWTIHPGNLRKHGSGVFRISFDMGLGQRRR